MKINFILKSSLILLITIFFLNSCGKQVDAKKFPPDPKERVKRNLEEGKGFRLSSKLKGLGKGGGDFEFASSNSLWRASLDIIDFMPLLSANYSGGIIITDWYSENKNESIKYLIFQMMFDAKKMYRVYIGQLRDIFIDGYYFFLKSKICW